MPKRKPYARPSFIRHELEAAKFEVKPQYVTVVDRDRKYVEVSDSFCQLVGYQREELVGKRYDDLTAPNTNDILCTVCGCSSVVKVPAFWSDMNHGFDLTHTSKGTWRS